VKHLLIATGKPIPQGRLRVPRWGKPYYPKTSQAYRDLIAGQFRAAWDRPAITEPVAMLIRYSGLRRNADPDNLLKMVLDALQDAGVIANDKWPALPDLRIVAVEGEPRVEVEITSARP